MGLLDIFKKNEKLPKVDNILQTDQKPFEAKFGTTIDGRLQVDFFDKEADFKQFYDTTRLIVNRKPLNLAGQEVYNCIVSWYGHDDCQMLNKGTGQLESPRSSEYKGILAQIDLNLLQTDSNYCKALMKELLNKKRVEKYIETGLEETPDRPCGKYIGGIMQTEKGYGKFFSETVGRASHNSNLMVNRRREYRENIENAKQRAIEDKRAQIERLQSEIDAMSR